MAPVLGLLVIVGVKVDVVQDDHIGSGKVNSQTTGSSGQQEQEYAGVTVISVNHDLPKIQNVFQRPYSLQTRVL